MEGTEHRRAERSRLIAEEIRARIPEGPRKSAMDFGCGTGRVGLQLIDAFSSLLFVDSSPEKIRQVEDQLSRLKNPALTTLCCDFTEAAPPGLTADYIFASLVLHHIQDTGGLLRRLCSLLRRGGHLLVAEYEADDGSFHAKHPLYDGHNGFDQAPLAALALEAGFSRADSHTFHRGVNIIQGNKAPYALFILDAHK